MNVGRNQVARDHLELIARSQNHPSPHLVFNLRVARLRSNDPSGALEMLEMVIEEKPDHALVLDQAARCAFIAGNMVKGRDW